ALAVGLLVLALLVQPVGIDRPVHLVVPGRGRDGAEERLSDVSHVSPPSRPIPPPGPAPWGRTPDASRRAAARAPCSGRGTARTPGRAARGPPGRGPQRRSAAGARPARPPPFGPPGRSRRAAQASAPRPP